MAGCVPAETGTGPDRFDRLELGDWRVRRTPGGRPGLEAGRRLASACGYGVSTRSRTRWSGGSAATWLTGRLSTAVRTWRNVEPQSLKGQVTCATQRGVEAWRQALA